MSVKDGQWDKALHKKDTCKHDTKYHVHNLDGDPWCTKCEEPMWVYVVTALVFLGLFALAIGSCKPVEAAEINLSAVAQIESSGRVNALGDNGHAYGLYQLTAPVIKEYGRYSVDEVRSSPKLQTEVARWYLHVRIPQMIRAYGKPVTAANQLVAYNAGIKYVKTGKPLPKITRDYLRKYADLTGGAL